MVLVTTPGGTASRGGIFIGAVGGSPVSGTPIVSPPRSAVISAGGISPNIITFGTPITLSGADFTGTTGLLIGGVPVTNFVVVNDNTITAVLGGVPVNERVILTGGLGANFDMSGLGIVYSRLPAPVIVTTSTTSLVHPQTTRL